LAQTSTAAWSTGAASKPFLPVRLVGSTNDAGQAGLASVTAQLPGGTQLQIPLGDRQALQLVIEALARNDALRAGGDAC
jgi:hypothetical protein